MYIIFALKTKKLTLTLFAINHPPTLQPAIRLLQSSIYLILMNLLNTKKDLKNGFIQFLKSRSKIFQPG